MTGLVLVVRPEVDDDRITRAHSLEQLGPGHLRDRLAHVGARDPVRAARSAPGIRPVGASSSTCEAGAGPWVPLIFDLRKYAIDW